MLCVFVGRKGRRSRSEMEFGWREKAICTAAAKTVSLQPQENIFPKNTIGRFSWELFSGSSHNLVRITHKK